MVTVPSLETASVVNSERKTQANCIVVLLLAFSLKDDQGWGLQLCLKAKQRTFLGVTVGSNQLTCRRHGSILGLGRLHMLRGS